MAFFLFCFANWVIIRSEQHKMSRKKANCSQFGPGVVLTVLNLLSP